MVLWHINSTAPENRDTGWEKNQICISSTLQHYTLVFLSCVGADICGTLCRKEKVPGLEKIYWNKLLSRILFESLVPKHLHKYHQDNGDVAWDKNKDVPPASVFDPSISLHPAHLKGCLWKEYRKEGGILNASQKLVYSATFTVSLYHRRNCLSLAC